MYLRSRAFDRFKLLAVTFGVSVAMGAGLASARSETLRWTHPDSGEVANWEAHVGSESGVYDQIIQLTNPQLGVDGVLQSSIEVGDNDVVFIALRAIGTMGQRSGLSNARERSPSGGGPVTPPAPPEPIDPPLLIQVVPANP